MPERLRVAVVGLGIGRGHTQSFLNMPDKFEVVALCDVDDAKARELAAKGSIPHVFSDYAQLCRLPDLDVIDICTPNYLHYAQVLEALEAGKHVICEKPLAGSLQQVDEIARTEARTGRRVMPIFQNRFGQGLQRLKFLAEQGLTGQAYLTTVETAWRRRADYYATPWRGKWKTELGGTLVTHAIHAHDLLMYILGPVKRVFARTATRVVDIQVEDCASASLEMADGSLASLSVTVGSTEQITRLRFCFANLTAESSPHPYPNSGEPWKFTADTPELQAQIDAALAQFVPRAERFDGQFGRFYDALKSGAELPVTVADARMSIELLTAIYASARSGQQVELPIGPEHPYYAGWLPADLPAKSDKPG